MKYAALGFVVALLLAAPAAGEGNGIQLSEEVQKKCSDEGGCILVSRQRLYEAFSEIEKAAREQAHATCGKRV